MCVAFQFGDKLPIVDVSWCRKSLSTPEKSTNYLLSESSAEQSFNETLSRVPRRSSLVTAAV